MLQPLYKWVLYHGSDESVMVSALVIILKKRFNTNNRLESQEKNLKVDIYQKISFLGPRNMNTVFNNLTENGAVLTRDVFHLWRNIHVNV